MGAGSAGEDDETGAIRSGNMDDKAGKGTMPQFASHWLTIQPHLFPEWEREMDRRECGEWERRQKEAAEARKAKRVSRASSRTAPPR